MKSVITSTLARISDHPSHPAYFSVTLKKFFLRDSTKGVAMTFDEPQSTGPQSVSIMISRLKHEDPNAAGEIWQRFFTRLLPLARARLKALPDQAVDEEDVLVSVFERFFRAVGENRFAQLNDRDDLWQFLMMLIDRKVAEHYRRSHTQKRGGGKVASLGNLADSSIGEIRELADQAPSPEFIAAFNENLALAMAKLHDDTIREVAIMRLEGYENREIAQRLQIGLSSVERKLRLIREVWQDAFDR